MKPTPAHIAKCVRALFKRAGQVISAEELARYAAKLQCFDENWQTAREALGDDWRYAQSLHEAGLLCRIQWPRRTRGGALVRIDTVYCRDPEDC